ncbi:MAG TPA: hypothetical protein VH877_09385 [Polyangia bacterium]|nr:hypothetical protein [Polyangia bacterium]
MKRLRFLLPATAICLLLAGGGCTSIVDLNSAQYRQEAVRKRALADQAAAAGDKDAAERYAREARVADARAEEKLAEEAYIANQKGDRDNLNSKSLPSPSNLPAP